MNDSLRQWWLNHQENLDRIKSGIVNGIGRTAYLIRGKTIPGLPGLSAHAIRKQYKQKQKDLFHCRQADKERDQYHAVLLSRDLTRDQVERIIATGELPKDTPTTPRAAQH